ncbi:hypothetical protein [Gemmobacter serpentinus]|uniref:hypothetical protein n=1 Tax=Gemmobacter serpentinus TaxID=2652247 RepID=UPI00124D02B5|nr:hypothetical protein [Gemmobacter serpentinus]
MWNGQDPLPLPGLTVRPLRLNIPFLWGVVTAFGAAKSRIVPQLLNAMTKAGNLDIAGFRLRDSKDMEGIIKEMTERTL